MKISLVIPVHNERIQLESSVTKLISAARSWSLGEIEIIIVDNASTDGTGIIAKRLAASYENVRYLRLEEKGRGRALRYGWTIGGGDILAYMDVDLSADISFFPLLIEPLIKGVADISIGSRLLRPEWTVRGLRRELISRCYNVILRLTFSPPFLDAQCGFKAITREVANKVLPVVRDEAWFFDTELLILADRLGYRILELPVRWKDDPDSRVHVVNTALGDLRGILRLRSTLRQRSPSTSKEPRALPRKEDKYRFREPRSAFTLMELMMSIAIIAILASLIIPATAKAKARAQGAVCANNLSQLQKAWQMYVDDNSNKVPDNTATDEDGVWRSTTNSWIGDSSAPCDLTTERIKHGRFFKLGYNRAVQLYVCPGDRSRVQSEDGVQGGRRTRSYSMNGNLGGRTNEIQLTASRLDDIHDPSGLFVFIDEQERSIDDGHFLVWPNPDDRWVNLPAGRHARSGVITFADGRVEQWHWKTTKQFESNEGYWQRASSPAELSDLRRLQSVILPIPVPPAAP